jgi:hypothetical protein
VHPWVGRQPANLVLVGLKGVADTTSPGEVVGIGLAGSDTIVAAIADIQWEEPPRSHQLFANLGVGILPAGLKLAGQAADISGRYRKEAERYPKEEVVPGRLAAGSWEEEHRQRAEEGPSH